MIQFIFQLQIYFVNDYLAKLSVNLSLGVQDYEGDIPPLQASVQYAYGYTVRPNDSTTSGLLTFPPIVSWPSEPDALYTVIIVDNGIERVLPKQYFHWMVVNIPGNNIHEGVEVIDYLTPFSMEIKDGKINPNGKSHPMLVFVYKQPKEVGNQNLKCFKN